jgi:hypothetical protein
MGLSFPRLKDAISSRWLVTAICRQGASHFIGGGNDQFAEGNNRGAACTVWGRED